MEQTPPSDPSPLQPGWADIAPLSREQHDHFMRLFVPNEAKLAGIVKKLVGDAELARDIYNATCAEGASKIDQLDHDDNFAAWMKGIAERKFWRVLAERKKALKHQDNVDAVHRRRERERELAEDPAHIVQEAEKQQIVRETVQSLGRKYEETYDLYYDQDYTLAGTAARMQVSVSTIKDRLEKIKMTVYFRVREWMGVLFVTAWTAEEIRAMGVEIRAGAASVCPELSHGNVTAGVSTLIGTAASSSAQMPVVVAQSEKMALSTPGMLSGLYLPLLWILSLFVSGRACAKTFISNAPSLLARRWVVTLVAWTYYALVAYPILLFGVVLAAQVRWGGTQFACAAYNWTVTFLAAVALSRLQRDYRNVIDRPAALSATDAERQFAGLQRTVRWGCRLVTVILAICFAVLFFQIILPAASYQFEQTRQASAYRTPVLFGLVLMVGCFGAHGIMYRLLRYGLDTARDEEAYRRSAPSPDEANRSRDTGFMLLVFAMIVTLVPSVLHVLLIQTRTGYSYAEFTAFALIWLVLYGWNRTHTKKREMRILTVLFLQIVFMMAVRDWIFV